MVFLLELKESFKKVYNKYDMFMVPAIRFILTLVSMLMINMSIGYMTKLKNPIIALFVAVVCAFLPNGVMIVVLSLFMLAHLYAISAEFSAIALCVLLLMYLLYFRFTPKKGYLVIITAMLCWLKVPYLLPVAVGLCSGMLSFVPVCFGVLVFNIIKTASEYETAITNSSVTDSMQQISYIVESFISNKSCILMMVAFAVTIIVVYAVRKLKIDNSWTYAVVTGTVVMFVILVVGQMMFNTKLNMIFIIVGTILGAIVGYLCQILFFSVDYKRTEYVQYEDDEYYYYVKAVPKINIVNAEVKVKQINARKTKKTNDISEMKTYVPDRGESDIDSEDDDEITFIDR